MFNKYTHGENHLELFKYIGDLILNAEIIKLIGMPITAKESDKWYVSDSIKAFGQARKMSNNSFHVRYLYAENNIDKEKLLKFIVDDLKKEGVKLIYSNDRKTETVWKKLSFKMIENKKPGNFVRWEKEI